MLELLVVLNPRAGKGKAEAARRKIVEAARDLGLGVCLRETTSAGHEVELAATAAEEGWPVVVAAGGDGTIHGVANGILATSASPRLGIIPVGTGNDFARLLNLQTGVEGALRSVAGGEAMQFDVGRVGKEYFVNSCGIGLGPVVLRHLERDSVPVPAPYLRALVTAFRQHTATPLRLRFDDGPEEEHVPLLVEVNIGTSTGGGFKIAPEADPRDGLADVCVIDVVGYTDFARYAPSVIRGKHEELPPVDMRRARRLRIQAGHELDYHLDGELRTAADGRLDIEVQKHRLEVLCES